MNPPSPTTATTGRSGKSCFAAIADVYRRFGYVMDPHTAVAYAVRKKMWDIRGKTVILSTADPIKFDDAVRKAGIDRVLPRPKHLVGIEHRPELRLTELPNDVDVVQAFIEKAVLPRVA